MDLVIWLLLAFIAWVAIFSYSLKFKFASRLLPPENKKQVELLWLKFGAVLGAIYFFIGYTSGELVWTVLGLIFICIWGLETIMK